jgi:hypothetical protein
MTMMSLCLELVSVRYNRILGYQVATVTPNTLSVSATLATTRKGKKIGCSLSAPSPPYRLTRMGLQGTNPRGFRLAPCGRRSRYQTHPYILDKIITVLLYRVYFTTFRQEKQAVYFPSFLLLSLKRQLNIDWTHDTGGRTYISEPRA